MMSLQLVTLFGSNWDDINVCLPQHIFQTQGILSKNKQSADVGTYCLVQLSNPKPQKNCFKLPINLDMRSNTSIPPPSPPEAGREGMRKKASFYFLKLEATIIVVSMAQLPIVMSTKINIDKIRFGARNNFYLFKQMQYQN